MIKLIAMGLWAMVVTVGSAYAAIEMGLIQQMLKSKATATERDETITTPDISVPVMNGREVAGYVIVKFAVAVRADPKVLVGERLANVIADEAFKVVFNVSAEEARDARKSDLHGITMAIRDGVNKRENASLVRDVLIKEWVYLDKKEARR